MAGWKMVWLAKLSPSDDLDSKMLRIAEETIQIFFFFCVGGLQLPHGLEFCKDGLLPVWPFTLCHLGKHTLFSGRIKTFRIVWKSNHTYTKKSGPRRIVNIAPEKGKPEKSRPWEGGDHNLKESNDKTFNYFVGLCLCSSGRMWLGGCADWDTTWWEVCSSLCYVTSSEKSGNRIQTPLLDFLKKRKEERRMAYQVRPDKDCAVIHFILQTFLVVPCFVVPLLRNSGHVIPVAS